MTHVDPEATGPRGDGDSPESEESLYIDLKDVLNAPEDQGPIGIFPSWKSLYWTVIVYTLAMIAILEAFSVYLDFSPS